MARSKKNRNGESVITGRASLSHNQEVVRWVRERLRGGWDRERILEVSRAGTHGWPVEGKALSDGSLAEVRAAIVALEYVERHTTSNGHFRAPSGKTHAQRRTELRERQRRGSYTELVRLQQAVSDASKSLSFVRLADYALNQVNVWAIEDLHADLMDLWTWADRALGETGGWLGYMPVVQRIAYLRARTVANGATEPEEESAIKLADALEFKLTKNRLTS